MRIPFPTWSALVGALLIALFGAAGTAAAAPLEGLDTTHVPNELKPWMGWALRGHETEACTQFRAGDANARECAWPGKLTLTIDAKGAASRRRGTSRRSSWCACPATRSAGPST